VLKETGAGEMLDSDDIAMMKKKILGQFELWKRHPGPVVGKAGVQKYSRKEITRRLTDLLLRTGRKETPSPGL
jgi:hypothetical protein